jgi:hypothetical protein
VRRPARNGPKRVDAAPATTAVAPRRASADYTEYSDLVELARRMSIPDDDAIRGILERAMRPPAAERDSEHR